MRIAELARKRVAVWGHGREGRAALASLRARLPDLPLTLFCSEAEARSMEVEPSALHTPDFADESTDTSNIPHTPIRVVTIAPDRAALSSFDVVIKSPGISAYRPEILHAQHAGTRFTSGTALWFAEHPEARVIAVTGTKGKSTVSALIAHLLRAAGRCVALAGNIGLPLLQLLDPPRLPDWWVIELSSFQTRDAAPVEVAVINNLYEEHLDWHGTRERYTADKLTLGDAAETLLLNGTQVELAGRFQAHPQRVEFGRRQGWHVEAGAIMRGSERVFDLGDSPLPGPHNAMNLCAALAAIEAAGEDAIGAAAAIASFCPLPHRLQTLGRQQSLTWIDDSIATTPQATLEALASLRGCDLTALVGGYDRGLDWHPFAAQILETPPLAIVTMGANGPRIASVLHEAGVACQLESSATLAQAVRIAREVTPANGLVLLSPGAPSFDQFRDYAERGREFARLAGFDSNGNDAIEGLGIG